MSSDQTPATSVGGLPVAVIRSQLAGSVRQPRPSDPYRSGGSVLVLHGRQLARLVFRDERFDNIVQLVARNNPVE